MYKTAENEKTPLVGFDVAAESCPDSASRRLIKALRYAVVCGIGVFFLQVVSRDGPVLPDPSSGLEIRADLHVRISNNYTAHDGWGSAQSAYPWLRSVASIVEPHRDTTLSAEGARGTPSWVVSSGETEVAKANGQQVRLLGRNFHY